MTHVLDAVEIRDREIQVSGHKQNLITFEIEWATLTRSVWETEHFFQLRLDVNLRTTFKRGYSQVYTSWVDWESVTRRLKEHRIDIKLTRLGIS